MQIIEKRTSAIATALIVEHAVALVETITKLLPSVTSLKNLSQSRMSNPNTMAQSTTLILSHRTTIMDIIHPITESLTIKNNRLRAIWYRIPHDYREFNSKFYVCL